MSLDKKVEIIYSTLFKWANPGLFFVYFRLFYITQFYKLMKEQMVCLGLKPGVAGWKAQTTPLSYGGTPSLLISVNNSLHKLVVDPCKFILKL